MHVRIAIILSILFGTAHADWHIQTQGGVGMALSHSGDIGYPAVGGGGLRYKSGRFLVRGFTNGGVVFQSSGRVPVLQVGMLAGGVIIPKRLILLAGGGVTMLFPKVETLVLPTGIISLALPLSEDWAIGLPVALHERATLVVPQLIWTF